MPELPEGKRPAGRAIALRYGGTGAPKVTATGRGLVADRIVEVAEANGVPVRRDPALAEALATIELGHEIPEELFAVVAELLAWAYALDGDAQRRRAQA